MDQSEIGHKATLSRRIFFYLLGIAFLSLICLGFFWIESRVSSYFKEVAVLKRTFSETKKLEIRNKILQIKDYIQWLQYAPLDPVSQAMASQINRLKPLAATPDTSSGKTPHIPKRLTDSIRASGIPVYILNRKEEIVFAFNPFEKEEPGKVIRNADRLLQKIRHGKTIKKGNLTILESASAAGPSIEAIAYKDMQILPGFSIVSVINAGHIENVLQAFILDSVSRMRYAENEYIFINTLEGMALVTNGRNNTSPIDIFSSGSTAWIEIFRVQQTSAKHPEGVFHTYVWQKLSSVEKGVKTSYFSYLSRWGWIIGTGFYADDINSIIELRKKDLYGDLRKDLINVVLYLLAASFLSYVFVIFFSRRLRKNIRLFTTFFEKVSEENQLMDVTQVNYSEFHILAKAANQMASERLKIEKEIRKMNFDLENRVKERTLQLESNNKELESFSYSISHDLRAPLRAIFGFSQILASRHRKSLNEQGQQYLDYIVEASVRMEKLISDLLQYSRLGRKSVDLHPVSLITIVDQIKVDFDHPLKDIGAELYVESELPDINGDETLLLQIFTNLMGNAITYRRPEVPLEIRISCNRSNNDCILAISDNGIGIPREHCEKIFNVFQRLHSDDKYPGTGIGLATVKKAAGMLSGSVWVESEVDRGSTFFIKLPSKKS